MFKIRRLIHLGLVNLLLVCSCISIELPAQVTFCGSSPCAVLQSREFIDGLAQTE